MSDSRKARRRRIFRSAGSSRVGRSLPLLAACLAATACQEAPEPQEVVRPIRAIRVVDAATMAKRAFPCRAEAVQEVNLAFEVPGQIIERPVDVGSEVEAGGLVARLDPRDFENTLARREAQVRRAKALRDRLAEARKSGAVSEQEFDDAQARLEAAEAEVAVRAKAVADTRLRAPFDGVVVATFAENFQSVQARQPVMRVLDMSSIECVVNLPENLMSSVPYVEDLQVTFDTSPDRPIPAAITKIGREASETTRTFPITVTMDQPDDIDILPGMAGRLRARVVLPDEPAEASYTVPMNALFSDDGERSLVWVIDEESMTAGKREVVKLSAGATGMRIQGVVPGEWIATSAVHYLREGQRVRLPQLERERGGRS